MSAFCLAACSGGGGGDSSNSGNDNDNNYNEPVGWQSGVFQPADDFANRCESPRSGIDPATDAPYKDIRGTALDERNWLRSWSNDFYLWYDEIADRDPANHGTHEYFDLLKTTELSSTGGEKDKFHFLMPTDDWNQQSQSGVAVGYGFQWAILQSKPPRQILAAYSNGEDSWPTGISRGARVLMVDGVDVVNAEDQASVDILNAVFFPAESGDNHDFLVEYPDGTTASVSLTASAVTSDPVQNENEDVITIANGKRVGYLLFNDHIATAEKELKLAVEQLSAKGIDELVLDLRYNGGGYLAIASQLAYMIAGPEQAGVNWNAGEWTANKTFEQLEFNNKHPDTDPFTKEPLDPIPFIPVTIGLSPSLDKNQPLPSLNLDRVFVLTGPNTCSASEAIINGLRGVGVGVVQIGKQTCGKPYGFYPTDNCGTTYFSIQFRGVNEKGFGDYSDGFIPASYDDGGAVVLGCEVGDDFSRPLGDVGEARLATALNYIETDSCGAFSANSFAGEAQYGVRLSAGEGRIAKSPWRQNRILLMGR
ncbi:S41 family peptidase [Microbulbifer taiwanensis]|uniref:S41 family peptidase n=1 Tax=Microbulbifer taiwanensis TaxID=986746 RepID=A0ABW1YNH2_9GAMM|nr:S41 family peptidase [Microbulbifer taiwanensis]